MDDFYATACAIIQCYDVYDLSIDPLLWSMIAFTTTTTLC
ncbi:unnamed protein product, partial [marine sediment metagenome]